MNLKSLAIGLVALTIGATLGVVGLQTISAATATPSTLVENLAKKFNTSTANVQSVFDQTKTDRLAARQKAVEDALTQAVKDGKITDAQKTTILSKLADIKTKIDATQAAQENLRTWATDNKVDLKTILPGRGFGHRHF